MVRIAFFSLILIALNSGIDIGGNPAHACARPMPPLVAISVCELGSLDSDVAVTQGRRRDRQLGGIPRFGRCTWCTVHVAVVR